MTVAKVQRSTQPYAQKVAPGKIPVALLIESLAAVHLASYVQAPFLDRGGLFIVGPPSVLKSTLLESVARNYADAIVASDVNNRSLNDLREQIAANVIRTLVIPEWRKLYERHSFTSGNVEGTIRALVGEGFGAPSFSDGRINQMKARCTILSGMQPSFQQEHFKAWEDSGFNRRFLWCLVRMENPHLLDQAVEEWRLLDFGIKRLPPAPINGLIPHTTTQIERAELRRLVRYQPGGSTSIQFALLVKMLAVFKWWYRLSGRKERAAFDNVKIFAHTLGREGAEIVL